jgi:hypothetical protein
MRSAVYLIVGAGVVCVVQHVLFCLRNNLAVEELLCTQYDVSLTRAEALAGGPMSYRTYVPRPFGWDWLFQRKSVYHVMVGVNTDEFFQIASRVDRIERVTFLWWSRGESQRLEQLGNLHNVRRIEFLVGVPTGDEIERLRQEMPNTQIITEMPLHPNAGKWKKEFR